MGLFDKKIPIQAKFACSADAYIYILNYELEKGTDPIKAAEKADSFTDMYVKHTGIPKMIAPEPQGIDKAIVMIQKVIKVGKDYPEIVDVLKGVVVFGSGMFAGKAVEDKVEEEKREEIDFSNININSNNYGTELETDNDNGGLPHNSETAASSASDERPV